MAFQIHDDMMDYQPVVDSGKPYYQDIRESKITLPLLGAMANAGDGNTGYRWPDGYPGWSRETNRP